MHIVPANILSQTTSALVCHVCDKEVSASGFSVVLIGHGSCPDASACKQGIGQLVSDLQHHICVASVTWHTYTLDGCEFVIIARCTLCRPRVCMQQRLSRLVASTRRLAGRHLPDENTAWAPISHGWMKHLHFEDVTGASCMYGMKPSGLAASTC